MRKFTEGTLTNLARFCVLGLRRISIPIGMNTGGCERDMQIDRFGPILRSFPFPHSYSALSIQIGEQIAQGQDESGQDGSSIQGLGLIQ